MINYGILNDSVKFYESKGFQRIESPWTITEDISNITKPPQVQPFSIKEKNKVLVASGEQSFLYLYLKGFLPKGKYQTITPCFRDESFDQWHTKYFMKNELIITDDVCEEQLKYILECACEFFHNYLGEDDVSIIKIDENNSFDIVYKGIELGSYGVRSCSYLTWIYGTGVAEPRLSGVLEWKKQIS